MTTSEYDTAHRIGGEPVAGRPIFVFSTPPTPNGDLHLGHLSGPYLGADVFVRFQRMNGAAVWHLTGSDDFQSYVVERARREGCGPGEIAARYSAEIKATLSLMDIQIDQYTETSTDALYRPGLQAFFSRLVASGSVTRRDGEALFDTITGDYLYEVDVSGGCPTCGQDTGGNICEDCGEPNACVDLVDPRSGRSDVPPRPGSVIRYSLPLHELRSDIAAHHRLGRVPGRLTELADRLFRRARLDVAITHPARWGVSPVEPGVDGQVIWVWPEMAYGFLHGIESLGRRIGQAWHADAPQQDWKIVHFFGYDNSFYHAILFPALYRLAFPDWVPDIDYHVNEFYLLEGAKFSTSRRHAIWGKEIAGPHSVDAIRFFLSRMRPEGRRTNFERGPYEAVLRDTLIGTWQRWLNDLGARVEKHHACTVPEADDWTAEDLAFFDRLGTRLAAVTASLGRDSFSLNEAAAELHGIVEDTIARARPGAAVANGGGETNTSMALELAAARLLAHCAAPMMPRFAARLAAALDMPPPAEWPHAVALVPPGTRINLARQVFFRAPAEPGAQPPVPARPAGATSQLLPWLRELVRNTMELPEEEPVDDKTLVGLGMVSLQTVALQYQILADLGLDITVDDLLGDHDIAALARLLGERAAAHAVTETAEVVRI